MLGPVVVLAALLAALGTHLPELRAMLAEQAAEAEVEAEAAQGDSAQEATQDFSEPKPDPEPAVDETLAGWVEAPDGSRCYYDPETHLPHEGWLTEGDETFYCDEGTGALHVGWLQLDGRSFWLDDGTRATRGVLLRNRWLTEADKTYHLGEDGAADEGWLDIDGARYCFDDVGAMRTGWVSDADGARYWLKPEDGSMATHEWVEIDGLWQAFDDDGTWVTYGEMVPLNDEADMAALTARQRAVIDACDNTPWPGKGLCAGWVSQVFATAGEQVPGGDACDMAHAWCVSDDLAQLKPGMIIAVPSHSRTENGKIWGHVCIYVGGGVVRDSGTYGIRRIQLGSWLAWFGTDGAPRWGWANGVDLSAG